LLRRTAIDRNPELDDREGPGDPAVPEPSTAAEGQASPFPAGDRLWTRQFIQVCISGFLSYASQMPIMPVIALWVVHLGGTASTLGFAAAAFSLTSFALRPLIGRLCDTWSTRGIFALGCLVSGAGSLLIMVPSLPVLYISQAINGLGWAAINTGGNTMVAELAPAHRRGAASGYYMLARGTMGFYLPFVALHLKDRYGYWLPFLLTAVAGLLAAPLVIGISERKRTRDRASMAAE
jgi:MFS family permease